MSEAEPLATSSFNEFQAQHPGLAYEEAVRLYGTSIDQARATLAESYGITTEELHEKGFALARVALATEREQAA